VLKERLISGEVKRYEQEYMGKLEELPPDDWARNYPFEEENVREFAEFCAESGGFQIF